MSACAIRTTRTVICCRARARRNWSPPRTSSNMTSTPRPVREPGVGQYSERVIHGEIYKARPEVNSVCHHHAPAFMPLLATGTDYVPVFHLGAVGGIKPPFWDQHDEFGDTNMLVIKPEEGASLARALGQPLDGADEAPRRHRRRHQRARLRVPLDLFDAQRRIPGAGHDHRHVHRFTDARRNEPGGLDQRQDHRAGALVGVLVDAGRQEEWRCRRPARRRRRRPSPRARARRRRRPKRPRRQRSAGNSGAARTSSARPRESGGPGGNRSVRERRPGFPLARE